MSVKVTTEIFVKRSRKIHRGLWNYSKVVYKGRQTPVKIICKTHGEFLQTPNNHYAGQGCPKCGIDHRAKKRRRNFSKTLKDMKKIHGGIYEYPKPSFENIRENIPIKCKIHGIFNQTIERHLRGHGCPKCAPLNRAQNTPKTLEIFVKESIDIHGFKYDYSLVEYENNHTKVTIICPIPGVFSQRPSSHIRGSGCPNCAKTGFDDLKPAILYYFKDLDTGLFKLGITNRTLKERFGPKKFARMKILKEFKYETGLAARQAEKKILEEFSDFRLDNENYNDVYGGYTEFFSKDILTLESF